MFLWRLLMAEEIPTGDKAVFAFLEMVALAFAFEGVSALLNDRPWEIWIGSLVGALIFFLAGIKWPSIRASVTNQGNAKHKSAFWVISILLVWLPAGYDYYDRHQNGPFETGAVPQATLIAPLTVEQEKLVHHLKAISANWETFKYQHVVGRTFVNETILLDGKQFENCTFSNTSYLFEGTAPYKILQSKIIGSRKFTTDVPMFKAVVYALTDLGLTSNSTILPEPPQ